MSYSLPWWDWSQWDWMALRGVNMPLSITGQEAVWQAVCRRLGMDDRETAAFLADPSVAVFYNAPPAMGQEQKDPTHTANFGVALQQRCRELGIGFELVYPGAPHIRHPTPTDCLIEMLNKRK